MMITKKLANLPEVQEFVCYITFNARGRIENGLIFRNKRGEKRIWDKNVFRFLFSAGIEFHDIKIL